jgi:hypothetical protein
MILSVADSVATNYAEHDLPQLYVVENQDLESLLFNRNCVGLPFKRNCLRVSEAFVRHISDELADAGTEPAELVILSKGLAYQLGDAFANVLDRSLPANFIATQRSTVSSEDAAIDVSYQRFDAPSETLLIGDTIASGATLVASLTAYLEAHSLRSVYLMSYAGSVVGARRIAAFCRDVSVQLTMLFGLAAFGLGTNGFDLSFLHPDTLTASRYQQLADEQFAGKPVSAVGWDFGSQVMSPAKYRQLCWLEAEKWGLHGHPSLALEIEPSDLNALAAESAALAD